MISAKLAFRISLGGAVVVLLLTIYSLFQPPLAACGDLAPGYAPVIAQELARSVADLQAIFGDGPSACRAALAAKLDFITWADCLVFIPAYGVFLLFFFVGMAPRDDRSALIGFILAALADRAPTTWRISACSRSPRRRTCSGFWLCLALRDGRSNGWRWASPARSAARS